MGLGAVGAAGEPLIPAFGHDAQQDLLSLLQIGQEQAFKLAAPVGIVGEILELLQRQAQMAFTDLLSERLRTPEKTVRQLFDLLGAEFFVTQGGDELLDRSGAV